MVPIDDTSVRIVHAGLSEHFCLAAQPIVQVAATQKAAPYSIIGMEILLRSAGHNGKIVSPGNVLSRFESQQIVEQLDRLVLAWIISSLNYYGVRINPNWKIFVNVSGQSISSPTFLAFTKRLLMSAPQATSRLCIEITEAAAVLNFDDVIRFMHLLKAYGCRFALDDFGSGFSSFSQLRSLPLDYVKIDGALVKSICSDSVSFAIVRAIYEICQMMGKATIAEWVETEAIMQQIQGIGINLMQGYAFGHPNPIGSIIKPKIPADRLFNQKMKSELST